MPQEQSSAMGGVAGESIPAASGDPDSQWPPNGRNWLIAFIPRWRWAFFALSALLVILSFNGQWRVGRDSAAYRGLAHHLSADGKYVFRPTAPAEGYSDQGDTRYPGMPVLLAAVEKVFGPGDGPAVGVVALLGVGVLLLAGYWAKRSMPAWLAVCVVFGMAANGRFLEHINEVLSDIPFLLGVVGLLIVFDRLVRAAAWGPRGRWLGALLGVLLLLAMMRPTFWVIGAGLALTCAWGVFRPVRRGEVGDEAKHRRLACSIVLGVLMISGVFFLLILDSVGKRGGGYQGKISRLFGDFENRIVNHLPQNMNELLEQALPESFFGTQLGSGFIKAGREMGREGRPGKPLKWGLSTVGSLLLIGAGIALARRHMLWGMLILTTIGTMLIVGSVPRYFLMVLPLLLVAWGDGVGRLARRAGKLGWGFGETVVFIGLGLVVAPNLLQSADLIREQRGFTRPPGVKQVGFIKAYRGGDWAPAYDVARMLRDNVQPGQRVIGPESTVLTYLSQRDVYGLGFFLPRKDTKGIWERALRRMSKPSAENQGFYFNYAIFPDGADRLYNDKDQLTGRLIRLGILRPGKVIARAGGYALATYEVVHVEKKRGRGLRGKDLARMGLSPATQKSATSPATTTRPATPERIKGKPGRGPRGRDTMPPSTKPDAAKTTPGGK